MASVLDVELLPALRRLAVIVAACLSLVCPAAALGASRNPAIEPADRLAEPWWAQRHQALLEAVNADHQAQLLMIGDSITNNYDKAHPPDEDFQPTWQQFYAPRKALNLGFSGDTTANVLWRLDHGEVQGLAPRLTVLLIGTNNTVNETAEQTESGIDAVVGDLESRLPQTRILVLAILPSDVSASKSERDRAVNRYLANCYGDNPRVSYLDIEAVFLKDGSLDASLFYDPRLPQHGKPLHPDTHAQRMMAEAIEPTVARLMDEEPRVPLAQMMDIDTAVIPTERLEQDSYDWFARHHAVLALQQQMKPKVIMLGDSITHFWAGAPAANHVNGADAWQSVFKNLTVVNMGFGWDRTQNVLWRLRQGELEGITPDWVVLEIGTNNLTGTSHARASTPQEAVEGIAAICREVHLRAPQSRIVLMAIFPRGERPGNALRASINATNKLLRERFGNDASIEYVDIGSQFLAADGSLPPALMPDGTHPSENGYKIWAQALIEAGVRP